MVATFGQMRGAGKRNAWHLGELAIRSALR